MKRRITCIFLIIILSMGVIMGCGPSGEKIPKSAGRAMQIAEPIFSEMIDLKLYNLNRDDADWRLSLFDSYDHSGLPGESGEGATSVWHYTSVFALSNRLYDLSKGTKEEAKYEKLNIDLFNEFEWYKGTATFVDFVGTKEYSIYGVNRSDASNINAQRGRANVAGAQNVYDDQMWIAREMIEGYRLSQNEKMLETAEYITNYCLGGWDCSLDSDGKEYGGILWGPNYTSRHTCSNGPIISPLVWLYEIYKDSDATIEYKYQDSAHNVLSKTMKKSDYYLMFAKKVYKYTWDNLKKGSDVFYDSKDYSVSFSSDVKYSTGEKGLDNNSLTYNSGAPLSGAVDLYRVTGEEIYLEQAKKLAHAAYNYFGDKSFKDGFVRYPTGSITTWFNFVLYRGFADLYSVWKSENSLEYINSFRKNINYSYENYYLDGFLPRDVIGDWNSGWSHDMQTGLMDQSSAAETMALCAQLERDFGI